jgi:DNA primase
MPGIDFAVLRREVGMQDVLNALGFVAVTRQGSQLHGPCPVHGSSSPTSRTFSVNVSSGRYYCHRCNSHGNQLELWAEVKQLSLYDAAQDLCRTLGRDIPWIERG